MVKQEAEKIYLVKAIHNIQNANTQISIATRKLKKINETGDNVLLPNKTNEVESEEAKLQKELQKLQEYHILKNADITNKEQTITQIDKIYKNENEEYTITNTCLTIGNQQYEIDIEKKTGKIIFINFEKENLYPISKEEILKNYVKYLNLYIIEDWQIEDNMLKSEKAKLIINIYEKGSRYIIYLRTLDTIQNVVEYVVP